MIMMILYMWHRIQISSHHHSLIIYSLEWRCNYIKVSTHDIEAMTIQELYTDPQLQSIPFNNSVGQIDLIQYAAVFYPIVVANLNPHDLISTDVPPKIS